MSVSFIAPAWIWQIYQDLLAHAFSSLIFWECISCKVLVDGVQKTFSKPHWKKNSSAVVISCFGMVRPTFFIYRLVTKSQLGILNNSFFFCTMEVCHTLEMAQHWCSGSRMYFGVDTLDEDKVLKYINHDTLNKETNSFEIQFPY